MSNSNVEISYIGGIDDKEKGVTLTGSCTLFEVNISGKKKAKVVVDAGMFQGAKGDNVANEEIDERILDADYLIVTHAHMDHTGRVPYLVKKGFRGRIIMSELTNLQELAMWEDYVRLTKNEIERISNKNLKTRRKLKNAFFIVSTIDSLNNEKFTHKLKNKRKKLEELLGTKDFVSAYNEAKVLLSEYNEKYGLESEKDIESVLDEVPTLLYDEDDIKKTVNYIDILDTESEYDLESFHPISSGMDPIIDELPKMVSNGFSESVPVLSHIKGTVTSKLKHKWNILKGQIEENKKINTENSELSEKLISAYNFVKWCEDHKANLEEFEIENSQLLNDTENSINQEIKDLFLIYFKGSNRKVPSLVEFYRKNYLKLPTNKEEYELVRKELENFGIKTESDINYCLPDLPEYNYDSIDIRKALSLATYFDEGLDLPSISNHEDVIFIDRLDSFDPKEILDIWINKRKKRIFIKKGIEKDIVDKLKIFVETNRKNIALSNALKLKLNNSLDLVEIYDGNHLTYLQKNKKSYLKAVNFISSYQYNPNNLKEPLVGIDELDDLINNEKNGTNVIHIKRIDDKRIYDILYSTSKDFYFEPKIRERVKEKLIEKIGEIKIGLKKENEKLVLYNKSVHLEKIYEAKLVLSSLDEGDLTIEDAKKLLENNNIKAQSDIDGITTSMLALYGNLDIAKLLKKINYINSIDDLPKGYDYIYIESIDDLRLFDFKSFIDDKKIFVKHGILKKDIEKLLKNHRNEANEKYKQEKDDKDLLKKLLYKAYSIVQSDEYLKSSGITKEKYDEAISLLKEYSVLTREDIKKVNKYEIYYPYSLKDVERFIGEVTFVGDDFDLNNSLESIYIDSLDDERIYDLPYIYKDLTKVVYIRDNLKDNIKKKLLSGMGDRYKMMSVRRKKRQELKKKLDWINFMYENGALLFNLPDGKTPIEFYEDLKDRVLKIDALKLKLKKYKRTKELYENLKVSGDSKLQAFIEAQELLKQYNINSLEDIDKVYKELHSISYTLEDIEKAISLLKGIHIDKNQTILESLKLRFFNAGHIEGSVQAVITVVVSEIDNLLNGKTRKGEVKIAGKRRLSYKNFGFSGDSGRIKDPNIAGIPESPNIDGDLLKLDYYQMESTYAGRLHPNKQKSIDDLVSSISIAPGKVLGPAFSVQRTQEFLMILLQKMLDSRTFIDEIRKLSTEIKELKAKITGISKSISDDDALEIQEEYQEEIDILEERIKRLKSQVFDYDIILDSPLSEKITSIYLSQLGDKYNLLNPDTQVKLFGREKIKYVKMKSDPLIDDNTIEKIDIYSNERNDKKEIVISASGMCDGGSITWHLKHILPNPNATIAFVGYCPVNTRGGKIKAHDEYISIDQKPYELNCNVIDIGGFSGHPDEEEILTFLTERLEFAQKARIVLTHGGEQRLQLAQKVKKEIKRKKGQALKIITPSLGETQTINL